MVIFHSYVKLPEGSRGYLSYHPQLPISPGQQKKRKKMTVQEAVKGMALGVEASASALLVYSSR